MRTRVTLNGHARTHVGGACTCRAAMAEAADADATTSEASTSTEAPDVSKTPMADRPTCVICLGMAGSGKTTFIQVLKAAEVDTFSCNYPPPIYMLGFTENHGAPSRAEESAVRGEP